MAGKYELERVREAARDERIELDEKRARDELGRFFAAWLDAYPFAADVLLEIQPDDFCKTVALGTPHAGKYDIYGVQISGSTRRFQGRSCSSSHFTRSSSTWSASVDCSASEDRDAAH